MSEKVEEKVIDIRTIFQNAYNKLGKLKNYDKEGFALNLSQWVDDLYFFYNCIAKNANTLTEAQKVKYDLPKNKKPNEGQVAYFNIGRGYPKELYDGHWCYVLKDLGNNMIIIPTTSFKDDNKYFDETLEMEIKIRDFEEEGTSRLRINQIRSIDIMRIHKGKHIYNVDTDMKIIKENISKILSLNLDNNNV